MRALLITSPIPYSQLIRRGVGHDVRSLIRRRCSSSRRRCRRRPFVGRWTDTGRHGRSAGTFFDVGPRPNDTVVRMPPSAAKTGGKRLTNEQCRKNERSRDGGKTAALPSSRPVVFGRNSSPNASGLTPSARRMLAEAMESIDEAAGFRSWNRLPTGRHPCMEFDERLDSTRRVADDPPFQRGALRRAGRRAPRPVSYRRMPRKCFLMWVTSVFIESMRDAHIMRRAARHETEELSHVGWSMVEATRCFRPQLPRHLKVNSATSSRTDARPLRLQATHPVVAATGDLN